MVEFETERLLLRDPCQADFPAWHRLLSDAGTMYYLQELKTAAPEESRANLEKAIAQASCAKRREFFFTVLEKDIGQIIGSMGYTVETDAPGGKIAHAGYFFLPEYHGRGYATEALQGTLQYAFTKGGVVRMQTGCITENGASERVMQRCGMKREALRKACVWHDGVWKDRAEYRMLEEEWQEQKQGELDFWQAMERLIADSKIVIDRPRDTAHPRYPDFIYPLDYGYLENTSSMDGGGIDLWKGSLPESRLDAIVCIIDLKKRDSEIKLLLGCTEQEKQEVFRVHNETEFMKGIILRREE